MYNKMPPYRPNFRRVAITLPIQPKHFSNLTILPSIVLEDNDDPSSMEDVLRELDKEKIEIVISKVIRRFNKPATIVRGLHDRKDVESITRDLKMKIGTGGTYKDKQIILQGDHRESVKTILLAKGFEEKSIEVL